MARNQLMRRNVASANAVELVPAKQLDMFAVELIGVPADEV
jgi:hypothetical protein